MLTPTTPYACDLGNGLVMRSLSTEDEAARLGAFNEAVHGEAGLDAMTRALILHHPNTRPEHWLYVEDTTTGAIVSSLALIPWRWQFEDATLHAAEMGIVGTDPAYRRRGLIRTLDRRFKELLTAEGYHLSHIQGIPYYYRQFGYEYALPLEGEWRVELHDVPAEPPPGARAVTFRQATVEDIPALARLYDEAMADIPIHAARDGAIWRYLLTHATETATARETWLVLDDAGATLGYWRIERGGFGTGLNVDDCSRLPHDAALAVLVFLKRLATERGKPTIRLNLPGGHPLVRTAQAWGARDLGHYAWQIHIPDVPRLLRQLAPIFERRIAGSMFAGLTRAVTLDMYRTHTTLHFERGKLTRVEPGGADCQADLRLPPSLIAPLALGYRTWRALREPYPDVACEGQSQPLIDTLFPRVEAFIHTIY